MKRVKTIGSLIIVLLILSSALPSGCFTKRYSPDMVRMFTQVFHAVPGGRSYDKHVIEGKIIETDEYGRICFSFETGGLLTGICIMQKYDEEYVYYYDNVSYLTSVWTRRYSEEEWITFKEQNDWNQPIDEEKMIKREMVKSNLSPNRESSIDLEAVKEAFYQTMNENGYIFGTGYFDYSQTGQEIFLVERYERTKKEDDPYYYEVFDYHLMILNADGSYDPENYLIKIDDLSQSNAPLAEIKARNGWVG